MTQKRPKSLDEEAVNTTLEMELYQTGLKTVLIDDKPHPVAEEADVTAIRTQTSQDSLVEQLLQRLEKIKLELSMSKLEHSERSVARNGKAGEGSICNLLVLWLMRTFES